ncbi:MAG: GHKL domain-containing protein [Roseburia sp.]|nr:GHKL domain-containing protein [Roseburia sp.]
MEVANSIPVENEGRKKDRNHGFGIRKIENVVEKYGGRFEKKSEQEMLSITVYLPI